MQMGGDVFAALDMPGDAENLATRVGSGETGTAAAPDSSFRLPACHGKEDPPCRRRARRAASPRVINVVDEQRFLFAQVYNPA